MTNIAYIRVSTNKQDEASQRHIITDTIQKTGGKVDEWISDTASGGTPWQERQIAAALDRAKENDCIIVSEVSRIARSTVGVLTFLQAAAKKKIRVVAVKSGIVLDNSTSSKIVITVLAMAAEIERDLLRERTTAALAARKARGLPVGRQQGATGKKNKLDGRWQEVEALLKAKVPKAAIARVLGVSRQTLHTFIESNYAAKVAKADQVPFDFGKIPSLTMD